MAVFAALVTDTLTDLHVMAPGQASRATPSRLSLRVALTEAQQMP